MKLVLSIIVSTGLLTGTSAHAETVRDDLQGKARVIDAGHIEIGGARVELYGVDAPDEQTQCNKSDGAQWNCGLQASWALAFTLAEHWVTCRPQQIGFEKNASASQAPQSALASQNSVAAICTIGPGQDIAETMLRQGWARAEESSPPGYASAEVAARQAKLGLWQQ